MPRVFLGVGSNCEKEKHLKLAIDKLRRLFGNINISNVYASPADKNRGDDYYNCCVELNTKISITDLINQLKTIEGELDRDRTNTKQITIDLDVLLYGDEVGKFDGFCLPHADLLTKLYVLKPMCDLAPNLQLPTTKKNLSDYLAAFDNVDLLNPITISW